MKRTASRIALCCCALAVPPLCAQIITGSIVGTVYDSSGLAVPTATIKLTNPSRGFQRQISSAANGGFTFNGIEAGEYTLAVSAAGFKTMEKRNLMLATGERLSAGTMVLELGTVSETVIVQARAAAVQTESAERADVVTNAQADNLLTLGRNVTSLIGLLPGVVDRTNNESLDVAQDLHVLGNRRASNNITVDGTPAIDIDDGQSNKLNVSQDAVAEVKVLLSNYQAEYGRMAGSNIQIVTKSGTRDFHGLGSYFKRHEQFNATDFFDNRLSQHKPRYRYNTWTYNIGGPIYIPGRFNRNRDKLFFFWQQEYWPTATGGVSNVTTPTLLERQGDFSQSMDLNNKIIVVRDPFNGASPFPGNRIPASQLDKSGIAILKLFPVPNYFDRDISKGQFNYVFNTKLDSPQRTDSLKLDYVIDSHNSVVFGYSGYDQTKSGNSGVPGLTANWPQFADATCAAPSQVLSARYTRIFSPTLLNEFQVGMMHQSERHSFSEETLQQNQRTHIGFLAGQFNPSINPLEIVPNLTFGGVTRAANTVVNGRVPFDLSQLVLNLDNKLTVTRGAHTVKAGLYLERFNRDMPAGNVLFNGAVNFGVNANNPLNAGYAYANAALGVFNSYSEGSARPHMHARNMVGEIFVQDNWKVRRRLTLDYGLRLYIAPPIYDGDNLMSGFLPSRFDPARQVQLIGPGLDRAGKRVGIDPITGNTYAAALIGAIAPNSGDPFNGMVAASVDNSYSRSLTSRGSVAAAPRIGFAYDVFGNGRTAVRGGVGVFYNRENMSDAFKFLVAQPPFVTTPIVNYGQLNALQSSASLLFPGNVLGRDPNTALQRVMNFSFAVQQDIGYGTILDVGYVGSLGRHLVWRRGVNRIPLGANFAAANVDPTLPGKSALPPAFLRPVIGYTDIDLIESASSSNYHSLQLTIRRRFTKNLQFGGSWTWSKSMDYNDAEGNVINTLVPLREWYYGPTGWDRTHVVKINYLYDVPKVRWNNQVARVALHNWQISGIASFVSGAPLGVGFTQTTATDLSGTPSVGPRIVLTGNPVLPKGERTFSRFFNTSVFQIPDRGTMGNAAKTVIRGPGINNWDIALFKNFPIHEQKRLQFRCEMYNAFNHTQFTNVDTTARFDPLGNQVNAQFGQYTAAARPRYIQLALRFYF